MKSLLKVLSNICFMLLLTFALALILKDNAYASTGTKLYVNGYNSERYPVPVLSKGYSYVPLDTVEGLLGYSVSYDESANTLTLNQPELSIQIEMTVGSNTAVVNKDKTELPYAPFILSDEPMVALRFISEAAKGKIVWEPIEVYDGTSYLAPSEKRIYIFTPHAVKLDSGNASISSNIYFKNQSLTDLDGRERNIGYNIVIPVLSGMKDSEFQKQLNDKFMSVYTSIVNESDDTYNEQLNDILGYKYNSSNDMRFIIADDSPEGLISLLFNGYVYKGGAHGMPYRFAFNIDCYKSEVLTLSELFKDDKDYAEKLVDIMNTIRITSSTTEYEGVEQVTELPSTQIPYYTEADFFYIKNDTLYIFYHPYELSFYARGFVEFRIPLEALMVPQK